MYSLDHVVVKTIDCSSKITIEVQTIFFKIIAKKAIKNYLFFNIG